MTHHEAIAYARHDLDGAIVHVSRLRRCTGQYPSSKRACESLAVHYVFEGAAVLNVTGHGRIALSAGDLLCLRGSRAMRMDVPDAVHQIVIVLPVARLSRMGWLADAICDLHVPAASIYGPMVSQFMAGLHTQLGRLPLDRQPVLLDILLELLSGVARAQSIPDEPQDDSRLFVRMQAFVNERLDDVTLDPQTIADAFEMSLRSVHSLFARKGHKTAAWIREQRLQRVRRVLLMADDATPIGKIASRLGFSDTSAFNRIFKKRFGVSPGQYRNDQHGKR